MQKKYTGFYLGYVIQNNDPDRGGKVKIYIPSLMPSLAEVPEEIDKEDADIKIDFKDFSTLPTKVVDRLKNILPWARQISPLIGPGAASSYNPRDHFVSTVDNPIYREEFAKKLKKGEEPENEPKAPGYTLQQENFILSAGHVKDDTSDSNDIPETPATDPDNNKLIPELYSNNAKGMFSIPSVGSLVWVFFENGEWDLPVYFGYHYSSSAWQELYGAGEEGYRGADYPNAYENTKKEGSQLLREKLIFNSRAGALSFTGTDYFSKINISHQNGTFLQLDNSGFKRLIYGKSSDLILGDVFETIKGETTIRSYKNYNIICDQSFNVRTGSKKYDIYEKAKDVIAERAAILSDFKTERTSGANTKSEEFTFGEHRENKDISRRKSNPNLYTAGGAAKRSPAIKSVRTLTPKEVKNRSKNQDIGLTIPPQTSSYKNISDLGIKEKTGLQGGEYNPPIDSKKAWENTRSYSKSANSVGWDPRPTSQLDKSPSTAGGNFNPKRGTSPDEIKNKLVSINKNLDDVLKHDTDGGDQCIEITKDYYMRVGAVNNDFPAVRVDPVGGIVLAGVVQGDNGASSIYKQTNLVEYTGNDSNFPCGNYTISCGNKFNVESGSGGVILTTTGVAEIAGVTTKISAMHLLELTTAGGISIDAGKSLTITADILSLRQSKSKQMALGGSVGVENNITIGGSAIVNGELYLQHVTAPAEIQTTDQTHNIKGWTHSNQAVGYIPEGRIIGRLTPEICNAICLLGGVQLQDTRNDEQYGPPTGPAEAKGYVEVPAWNDAGGFKLGVKPEYTYDDATDEWVEKPNTGFGSNRNEYTPGKVPAPESPPWGGNGSNAVPLQGTDRITAVELEVHAHQFKNLPLSLRATPHDVIAEAKDVENYPEVRGMSKGSRPAKILVKEYGESKRHKTLQTYLKSAKSSVASNNNSQPNITGRGVGNQDDIRST